MYLIFKTISTKKWKIIYKKKKKGGRSHNTRT